jgi:hypothetical protein
MSTEEPTPLAEETSSHPRRLEIGPTRILPEMTRIISPWSSARPLPNAETEKKRRSSTTMMATSGGCLMNLPPLPPSRHQLRQGQGLGRSCGGSHPSRPGQDPEPAQRIQRSIPMGLLEIGTGLELKPSELEMREKETGGLPSS